jgi:phosphate transport system substrate-binding protein
VVIKQNNQKDQQAGEAYTDFVLSNQGQALIGKAGFVPIR